MARPRLSGERGQAIVRRTSLGLEVLAMTCGSVRLLNRHRGIGAVPFLKGGDA
jgi:hypothetical protein